MQKRNPKTREYEPYEIPRNHHCPLITNDMDEIINCASCGIETTYGVCYTSKEIHTEIGFGYPVCKHCYSAEKDRKEFYSSSTIMTDKPITTVDELIDQCMIKIRIDYLSRDKEVRHIFTNTDQVGRELFEIISQGATDIRIYKREFIDFV